MIESKVEMCSFAMAGTYGHECGKPATQVAVKRSDLTDTGFYYAGRCDYCAAIKGGENGNIIRFEPLNGHINRFK